MCGCVWDYQRVYVHLCLLSCYPTATANSIVCNVVTHSPTHTHHHHLINNAPQSALWRGLLWTIFTKHRHDSSVNNLYEGPTTHRTRMDLQTDKTAISLSKAFLVWVWTRVNFSASPSTLSKSSTNSSRDDGHLSSEEESSSMSAALTCTSLTFLGSCKVWGNVFPST